jgi:5-methylcytosine-specific restriction endonuclease McrA
LDPQVHHKVPFHDRPELELDPTNLVTLCGPKHRNHHLDIGHLGDYKCYNHNIDAWLKAVADREEE